MHITFSNLVQESNLTDNNTNGIFATKSDINIKNYT